MAENACKSREHQIVDALFGDLDAAGLDDLKAHLNTCSGCTHAFQRMQHTLTITSQVPEPEMPESYWESYFDKLQARMQPAEKTVRASRELTGLLEWFERWFVLRPAVLQWSAAIALVLVGIFIGRQWRPNENSQPLASSLVQQADPLLTPARLNQKTQTYLDRSKVLLLGLVNFDINEDDPAFLNLEHQQRVAGELVVEAASLKEELTENREQHLSKLVEELELILLQIANLEMQEDVPSIELIQRGVDQGALLLKINLEKMKLSDQESSDRMQSETPREALVF